MRFLDKPKFMKSDINKELNIFELNPVVKHWILHVLVRLGGVKNFINKHGFTEDSLVYLLNLEHEFNTNIDPSDSMFNRATAEKELQNRYNESTKYLHENSLPQELINNIQKVKELVGLSELDCRLLEFAVILHIDSAFSDAVNCLGEHNMMQAVKILSSILNVNAAEVRAALHADALLAKTGMLKVDIRHSSSYLTNRLDLLSSGFADILYSGEAEPLQLLRDVVIKSSKPVITMEAYDHIKDQLSILIHYIQKSVANKKSGVNILLYGQPGVGKTQLTKLLAELTCNEIYEVSSKDIYGEAVDGMQRLNAFQAAQSFLGGRAALLVFDETEDIFSGGGLFSPRSIADTRKAWMNKVLEENVVPTFWLSNDVDCIDNAFIRRFDMAIEIPLPNRAQRLSFLHQQCGDVIEEAVIQCIADTDYLSPAVVERSVKVLNTVKDELPKESWSDSLQLLINGTLKTQRYKPINTYNPNKVPKFYDPAFIQADKNLQKISEGLKASKKGRLCLYGPPGTGKTAYGKWLADQLEMPIIVKRASDLMSMWLGESEKNIAAAFAEAKKEQAVLLIDEVDSFLQDRRGASKSWEISCVNEMLTQMECFNGIFIASTNLMQGLDQASLRRFDLKIEFAYLNKQQRWALFQRHCQYLCLVDESELLRFRLERLNNITPGDFAVVARQNNFNPIKTASDFVKALEEEAGFKEDAPKNGMGFIQH